MRLAAAIAPFVLIGCVDLADGDGVVVAVAPDAQARPVSDAGPVPTPSPDAAASEPDASAPDAALQQDAAAAPDAATIPDASITPPDAGAPIDPCPNLPIPRTCFGRSVVYREWGPNAVGDGSYFADQAPGRLGFNRVHGVLTLVKFRLDLEAYVGRVAAYGDSVSGVAWISDQPCDGTFPAREGTYSYGNHGGGSIDFAVVRNQSDADRLHTDPAFANYAHMPQLQADHCYYVAFENSGNITPYPMTADYFSTTPDWCGNDTDPSCYYLAFDFAHQFYPGVAIPGL